MMESQVVLLKIGVMFMVMLAGWGARRGGFLNTDTSRTLGVFVVQVTFPALVFTQMLSTVSLSALRGGWWLPPLAVAILLLMGGSGYMLAGLFRVEPGSRRTFVFLTAVPNWVFLPLPIAEGLYGAEGVRVVLLFNFGAQIALWTVGVRLLVGGRTGASAWRGVLLNPGILATVLGAAVAVLWPEAATLSSGEGEPGLRLLAEMLDGALKMLGGLTIPLSLLVTGAQLGDLAHSGGLNLRALSGVVVGRLLLIPIVVLLLLRLVLWAFGFPMTAEVFITLAVIIAMPVAISCTMFVERFGGDAGLSAAGIFYTTLFSLATVPLTVLACRLFGP